MSSDPILFVRSSALCRVVRGSSFALHTRTIVFESFIVVTYSSVNVVDMHFLFLRNRISTFYWIYLFLKLNDLCTQLDNIPVSRHWCNGYSTV